MSTIPGPAAALLSLLLERVESRQRHFLNATDWSRTGAGTPNKQQEQDKIRSKSRSKRGIYSRSKIKTRARARVRARARARARARLAWLSFDVHCLVVYVEDWVHPLGCWLWQTET